MRIPGLKWVVILGIVLLLLGDPVSTFAQQPSPSTEGPRGALFSEEGPSGQPLSVAWFAIGLYVLAGLIFAGCCAHGAVNKALQPVPWFFVGLFLNAVGYLVLLTRSPGDARQFASGIPRGLRKVPRTYYSEECPNCGYHNHPGGDHCEGCRGQRTPLFESEAARWRKQTLIQ